MNDGNGVIECDRIRLRHQILDDEESGELIIIPFDLIIDVVVTHHTCSKPMIGIEKLVDRDITKCKIMHDAASKSVSSSGVSRYKHLHANPESIYTSGFI